MALRTAIPATGESFPVKSIGEPDAVTPHVRFDERGMETESWNGLRHRHSDESRRPTATPRSYNHRAIPRLYVRHDGARSQLM